MFFGCQVQPPLCGLLPMAARSKSVMALLQCLKVQRSYGSLAARKVSDPKKRAILQLSWLMTNCAEGNVAMCHTEVTTMAHQKAMVVVVLCLVQNGFVSMMLYFVSRLFAQVRLVLARFRTQQHMPRKPID